ncbi:hypothetical protein OC834_003491 [Tilletia horrida]|nr:hypothetical protein OC834_003491 [Tilletia horrida]
MTDAAIDNELRAFFAGQLGADVGASGSGSRSGSGLGASVPLPGALPPTLADALLVSHQLPLLALVRKLGPQLTGEDAAQRARAVLLLAAVVEKAAAADEAGAVLNPQAVRTLTTFFTDKVEDAVSILSAPEAAGADAEAVLSPTTMIQAVLTALYTLSTLAGFPAGSLGIPLADALTTHVPPIKHLLPQAQRFAFFRLFDALLARHRAVIFKQKGKADAEHDILAGYTKFAEGEKDPRNLVYAFAIDWVILTEFDLEPKVVEAFFDITFCYFPITFRPPPSDPYGITTAQLKTALSRALTSTPHFYAQLFPLVLEKLSASPTQTKLDCLHLLAEALPVWGRAAVSRADCATKLWNVLETEIMHPADADSAAESEALTNAAVNTLIVLLRTLYSADPSPERQWPQVDPPAGLAPTIVAKASSHLREPASALAPRAAKYLLGACARADKGTAYLAAYAACDVLLPIFKDPEEGVAVRAPVLRCLSDVVHGLRTAYEEHARSLAKGTGEAAAVATGFKFDAPTSSTSATPQAAAAESTDKPAEETEAPAVVQKQRRTYFADNQPLHPFRLPILSALSNGLRAPVISSSTASGGYRASAMNLFVNLAHIEGFFTLGGRKPPQPGEEEDEDAEPEREENELEWGVREITSSLTQTGPTLEWSSAGSGMDVDEARAEEQEGPALEEETSAQIVARQAAILALQEIRTIPPAGMGVRLLEVEVLPQIFALLPDRMAWPSSAASSSTFAVPRSVELQRRAVRTALSTVTALCDADAPALCELAVVRLCTKIELAGATSLAEDAEAHGTARRQFEENVAYVRGLLSTLAAVLAASAPMHIRMVALGRLVAGLPTRLIALVLKHLDSSSGKKKVVLLDAAVLRQLGELLVVLVRALGQSAKEAQQFELARKLEAVFVRGDLTQLGLRTQFVFEPFATSSSQAASDTLFLFAASSIPLSSAVPLPTVPDTNPTSAPEALASWLETVLRFTAGAQTAVQADAGYALLVCALNKYATAPLPAVVQSVLQQFWAQTLQRLGTAEVGTEAGLKSWERSLGVWLWASKALLSRGGPNASEGLAMLDLVIEKVMCADGVDLKVQKLAATSLAIVTRAEDGVLTKENGAVVRPLARQRLFSHLLPKLIDGYKAGFQTGQSTVSEVTAPASTTSAPSTAPPLSPRQSIFLIAFTAILPHLPRPLLKERMRALFPLLVRSLDLSDPSSRAAAARTVTYAAGVGKKEKEEALMSGSGVNVNDGTIGVTLDLVQEYVDTLLERLLGMLVPAPENTPLVRIAALRCLATLARTVPHISIHKQANRVLRALAARGRGIDDAKRTVRLEAVDAREAFFVLSAQKG